MRNPSKRQRPPSGGLSEATTFHMPAPVQHQANGLGIDLVFLDQDSRRQRVHGVPVQDRDWGLQNDGTAIEIGCHEMNGGAADSHAMLERLPLSVQTRKCRKKRGVNV